MPETRHHQSVLLGCACMFLSTLCFSVMHACVRYLSEEIHPFEIAFFRNAFGVVLLTPLVLHSRGALLKTQHLKWHVVRACFNIFAMLIFFYALAITPLATVQALSFTAPLFTTVLAIFILREKVRLRRWAAIIVGFIGVLIILRPGSQPIELGFVLVLCSAAIWALTMIVIKRLSNTDSPLTITIYVSVFLSLMSLVPAMMFWTWPQGNQWLWLFFAAAVGTLGQLCVAKAFAYADTTVVLPIDFAKILWGALIGYYLFAEQVSIYTWIGAVVIFSGATYLVYREHQLAALAVKTDVHFSAESRQNG